MLTLTTFIVLDVLATEMSRKWEKSLQIEKKEVKLCLFLEDMILYIEKSKDTTRKLLEIINEYSKVVGYKINVQKSVVFLYTNNKISKRNVKKKTNPFKTA